MSIREAFAALEAYGVRIPDYGHLVQVQKTLYGAPAYASPHPNILPAPRGEMPPRKLYVVLEHASVEICPATPGKARLNKAGAKPTLLNCDDHQGLIAKMGRDVSEARPDITHQVGHMSPSLCATRHYVDSSISRCISALSFVEVKC